MTATEKQQAAFESLLNRPWTNPVPSDVHAFVDYTDGILTSISGLSSVSSAYDDAVRGAYPAPSPSPPTLSITLPDDLGINKLVVDAHNRLKVWVDEYVTTYYTNEQPVALVVISTSVSLSKNLEQLDMRDPPRNPLGNPIVPECGGLSFTPFSRLPENKTWDEDMVGSLIGSLSRPLEYILKQRNTNTNWVTRSYLTEAEWIAANGSPAAGDVWYDATTSTLKQRNTTNTNWVTRSYLTEAEWIAANGSPAAGDVWYDTTISVVKQRNTTNTNWVTRSYLTEAEWIAANGSPAAGDVWYDTASTFITSQYSLSDALLAYQQLYTYAPVEWEAYKAAIRSIPTVAASAIASAMLLITSTTVTTPTEAETLKADIESAFDVLFNPTTGTIKIAVDNLAAASAALVSNPNVLRNPIAILTSHCTRIDQQIAREQLWWGDLHTPPGNFSNFRVTSIIGTAAGYALNLKIYNSPTTPANTRAAWSRIADNNIRDGINE